MLSVKGQLLSFSSRTFKSKTDNSSYIFYTGYFLGPAGGRPAEIEMGTDISGFEIGEYYEVQVYVRVFELKSGGIGWQLMKPKEGFIKQLQRTASNVAA